MSILESILPKPFVESVPGLVKLAGFERGEFTTLADAGLVVVPDSGSFTTGTSVADVEALISNDSGVMVFDPASHAGSETGSILLDFGEQQAFQSVISVMTLEVKNTGFPSGSSSGFGIYHYHVSDRSLPNVTSNPTFPYKSTISRAYVGARVIGFSAPNVRLESLGGSSTVSISNFQQHIIRTTPFPQNNWVYIPNASSLAHLEGSSSLAVRSVEDDRQLRGNIAGRVASADAGWNARMLAIVGDSSFDSEYRVHDLAVYGIDLAP